MMSGFIDWGVSEFGGSWYDIALHEVGHALGLGHSYDIPSSQGAGITSEDQYPGNHDIVHGQRINPLDGNDIDVYEFSLAAPGVLKAEIVAERLATSSFLDSALRLYRQESDGSRTLIAQNDDFFSDDAYIELEIEQSGTYFLGVSASGNMDYDPTISDTGFGGNSDGNYELRLSFDIPEASSLTDATGRLFDGDADGKEGGTFEFSFRSDNTLFVDKTVTSNLSLPLSASGNTIFVDEPSVFPASPGFNILIGQEELAVTGVNGNIFTVTRAQGTAPASTHALGSAIRLASADGSEASPFGLISDAIAAATAGDIIRIVGNGGTDNNLSTAADSNPYLIGRNDNGIPLEDGESLELPQGVILQIDAGATLKLQSANIDAGSSAQGVDRSGGAVQVLGTPDTARLLHSVRERCTWRRQRQPRR